MIRLRVTATRENVSASFEIDLTAGNRAAMEAFPEAEIRQQGSGNGATWSRWFYSYSQGDWFTD